MLNSIVGLLGDSGVANSYESIATVSVGAGGQTTISFTSIPSTYKHLQVRGILKTDRATYGNDGLYVKVNSNSSNYAQHYILGDGSAASASGGGGNTQILIGWAGTNAGNSSAANVIDILDYADTNKYKTFRNLSGVDLNGTVAGYGGLVALHSGMYYGGTSAITQLDFTSSNAATFQQYSHLALYGIKG